MNDKIFIDTDVILDLVFERKPFFYDAQKIVDLVEKKLVIGYTSSLIIANCYYIISGNKSKTIAAKAISKLRTLLEILPFTDKEIGESLNANMKDFEDGVQYFIAINHGLKTIITRNIGDYKNVDINVLLPGDYLNLANIRKKVHQSTKARKKQ